MKADWETIAQGRARAFIIEQYFGVKPDMEIAEDYVRLYYPPDKMSLVQKRFKENMEKPPGKVRVDMNQVFVPWAVEKMSLPLLGLFALGLLLGHKYK